MKQKIYDWFWLNIKKIVLGAILLLVSLGAYNRLSRNSCDKCGKWNAYTIISNEVVESKTIYQTEKGIRKPYEIKKNKIHYKCKYCEYECKKIVTKQTKIR